MLGKRARQIQRTTSMSHLGPQHTFTDRSAPPSVGDSGPPPTNPSSAAGGQKIWRPLVGRQDQSNQSLLVEMVEDGLAKGLNLDKNACQDGGPLLVQESSTLDQSDECYTSLDRSMEKSTCVPPQTSNWAHHMVSAPRQAKLQDAAYIRPAEFLKVCFFCKRRLGQGQDIYMYRGDVAFCSEECRNHQILKDERKDKCSISASIKGSATPAVSIESGGKVISSGTAVGA